LEEIMRVTHFVFAVALGIGAVSLWRAPEWVGPWVGPETAVSEPSAVPSEAVSDLAVQIAALAAPDRDLGQLDVEEVYVRWAEGSTFCGTFLDVDFAFRDPALSGELEDRLQAALTCSARADGSTRPTMLQVQITRFEPTTWAAIQAIELPDSSAPVEDQL
jgi:hypothetical protein